MHGQTTRKQQRSVCNLNTHSLVRVAVSEPCTESYLWYYDAGDTACIDSDGYYKILGRTSVDIIKSGGYKISALDVEGKLLLHPDVSECAVLGAPDTGNE